MTGRQHLLKTPWGEQARSDYAACILGVCVWSKGAKHEIPEGFFDHGIGYLERHDAFGRILQQLSAAHGQGLHLRRWYGETRRNLSIATVI